MLQDQIITADEALRRMSTARRGVEDVMYVVLDARFRRHDMPFLSLARASDAALRAGGFVLDSRGRIWHTDYD